MLVIAIPVYTCASASTPIAAALILKGLDPGAALVFLLAGPATNLGAVIILLKILGTRVVTIYLASIAVVSVVAGYVLNWLFARWQFSPVADIGAASGLLPEPLKIAGAVALTALLAQSLWRTPVPEEWRRVGDGLATMTGIRVTARGAAVACAIVAAALYLGAGLFTVGVGETAIRSRFGRIVGDRGDDHGQRPEPLPQRDLELLVKFARREHPERVAEPGDSHAERVRRPLRQRRQPRQLPRHLLRPSTAFGEARRVVRRPRRGFFRVPPRQFGPRGVLRREVGPVGQIHGEVMRPPKSGSLGELR